MRPLPKWALAVRVYRKGDWLFSITGSSYCKGRPLKGLSRVMGNYHARFLGGKGVERPLLYPVFFDHLNAYNI